VNRSDNMRRIKSRDTGPEMTVRRLVHSMGYRYRLHRNDLPGKPDLVFPARRKVIFVHGCFWHSHGCKLSHTPKSNDAYWSPKLARNKVRDEKAQEALLAMGWGVLVIWECQLKDREALNDRLTQFLTA
jgi:DNA mismatch endonuclease (patch repair protein)